MQQLKRQRSNTRINSLPDQLSKMKGQLKKSLEISHTSSDPTAYDNDAFEGEPVQDSVAGSSCRTGTDPQNEEQPVPYLQLFRFSSTTDKWLIAIATLSALATGPCLSLLVIFFGDLVNSYIDEETNSTFTELRCNGTYNTSTTYTYVFRFIEMSTNFESNIQNYRSSAKSSLDEDLIIFSVNTSIVGVISVLLNFIFVTFFNLTAENQVHSLICVN